jgi:hypothetical protein
MMLAQRVEGDIPEDHRPIILLPETAPQHLQRVPVKAREEVSIHGGDAPRRLGETLTLGILADGSDDLAHRLSDLGAIYHVPCP